MCRLFFFDIFEMKMFTQKLAHNINFKINSRKKKCDFIFIFFLEKNIKEQKSLLFIKINTLLFLETLITFFLYIYFHFNIYKYKVRLKY